MILCIDDLSMSTIKELEILDKLHQAIPHFKATAFVITHHNGKAIDANFISECELRSSWLEIGLHAFDHEHPPDPEREDYEERITAAYNALHPIIPKCYRPAGFQHTIRTMPLMKKLGIGLIVHQDCIQEVKTKKNIPAILGNSHFDSYNSDYIGKIAPIILSKYGLDKFYKISEVCP